MISLLLASIAQDALIGLLGIFIIFLFYSTWTDVKRLRQRQAAETSYAARRRTVKLNVAIIIWAHNDEHTIENSLRALRLDRYRRYTVTIVDVNSCDDTKAVIKRYMSSHPTYHVGLYSPRTTTSKKRIVKELYKRSRQPDVIVEMGGSSVVPARFLKTVTMWFLGDKTIGAVHFYDRQLSRGLLSHYFHIIDAAKHQLRKNIVWQPGTIAYTPDSISHGARYFPTVYESRFTIIHTKPVPRQQFLYEIQHGLTNLTLGVGATVVWLLMSYGMTIAGLLITSQLLFWSWLIVIVLGSGFLLNDETMEWRDRISIGLILPSVFFLFYTQVTFFLLTTLFNLFKQAVNYSEQSYRRVKSLAT
jgi:ABC-type multidrug transport system fused ATPase/permease subunit